MPGTSCIRQTMQRCGKSGSRCHPRSRLGFTDDASTDISCNIMPPPAPHPPHHLSAIQRTCRHKIPLVFFFFQMWQYSFSKRTKRTPAGRVAANLVGAVEKKRGYRLHKRPEWMSRSQTKQPIGMFPDASVCILPLSERKRSGMRPNWHLTWIMLILPARFVQKEKWLIYTRRIYFPCNLCKQLYSGAQLCLKRPQQMPVNGPSMSVSLETCSLLESWAGRGRSFHDGQSSERLLITSGRYSEIRSSRCGPCPIYQ